MGYCPICGHWSISTDIIVDSKTNVRGDRCFVCSTIFDISGFVFIDSKVCSCGHPKSYHEHDALVCMRCKETGNYPCKKYRPTEVTIKEIAKKTKEQPNETY
jgi:hypothetical protein